jgi:hypothetical protein
VLEELNIRVKPNELTAQINGLAIVMPHAPVIINDKMMVSVELLEWLPL